MTRPEDTVPIRDPQTPERGASLVSLPIAATILYYSSPRTLRDYLPYQFLPQMAAYAAFFIWTSLNTSRSSRSQVGVEG